MSSYQGGKLADGTPLNVAVYKAYRNAGLSHSQALAITAEVGRENGFNPSILFGYHEDPAANTKGGSIRNTGMLSWNGGRGQALSRFLQSNGVMQGGTMAKNQANLNAQAKFSVQEMKSPKYAKKLKTFWSNPNANPDVYSRELGKHYIVWAYGQNTIRAKGGGRQAFDWKSHDQRRRNHLQATASMLGGDAGDYSEPEPDPRLAMSAPELIKALRKDKKMNDNELFVNLVNGNGRAAQELNYLLDAGHDPAEIAKQLGLKVDISSPQPQQQQQTEGLRLAPEEMQILGISDFIQQPDQQPLNPVMPEQELQGSTFTAHSPDVPNQPQQQQQPQSGVLESIKAELPTLQQQGLSQYQAIYSLAQRNDDIGNSIRGAFSDGMNSEQIANYFGANELWQSQNAPSNSTLTTDAPRAYQMPSS